MMERVAITIQRFWRGYRVRRKYGKYGIYYRSLQNEKKNRSNGELKSKDQSRVSPRNSVHFGERSSQGIKKDRAKERPKSPFKMQNTNRTHMVSSGKRKVEERDVKFIEQSKVLIECCMKNQVERLEMLSFAITSKHVKYHDDMDNTALFYTAKHKNRKLSSLLMEIGADPNEPCHNGNTPFHVACLGNNKHVGF